MKILVAGTGGVGGYFGGKLARAGEAVTFLARGEHLRAILSGGLRVRSWSEGEWAVRSPATDDPEAVGPVDLILFCVKSFDTEKVARAVLPAVGPETTLLSLQNGVDNEEKIEAVVGPGRVMGGVAYVLATIEAPGVILHTHGGKIAFGELDGSLSERGRGLRRVFDGAGIPAELTAQIRRLLWEKYLFIATMGGLTALTRCQVGVVRSNPETRRLLLTLLDELARVAQAAGAPLLPGVVDATVAAADALPPGMYSSLYHDLIHGKRLELEALQGHAVRLGEALGVPTPALCAVYAALAPYRDGPPPSD
ncbi:MAG: 2-dehydropantoate 2-reductase [candidate division NC10 bacterium]